MILNFINKLPDDPEVIQAEAEKKSFNSPLGLHMYLNGRYTIVVPKVIKEAYDKCGKGIYFTRDEDI